MNFEDLTEEQMRALPPELLKQLYDEHMAGASQEPQVIDKMHPDISMVDRAVVKNLASSPQAGMGYLKKQYPHLDFKAADDGEIHIKHPTKDAAWMKLDPSHFEAQDISDVAADVGQGVAEGIGGGLVGLSTLNPFAGAATAGGIGAASEAGKQGLGSLAGIPNNYNPGNIAMSGAASAIMPTIGKGISSAWGMAKKYAPKVGSYLSDLPEELIRNINKDADVRNKIAKEGVTSYVDNLSGQVNRGMDGVKGIYGKAVGDTIGNNPVNIAPLKEKIASHMGIDKYPNADLQQLMTGSRGNKAMSSMTDKQRAAAGYLFDELDKKPNIMSARDAINDKNYFYGVSQADKSVLGHNAHTPAMGDFSPTERQVGGMTSMGYRDALREAAPDKTAFDTANNKYSDLMDTYYNDKLKPFASNNKTQTFLDKYSKPTRKNQGMYNDELFNKVNNYAREGGENVNLQDAIRGYQSHEIFHNPSMVGNNSGKLAGIMGSLGAGIGYVMPGGNALTAGAMGATGGAAGSLMSSPWAIKQIAEKSPVVEDIVKRGGKVLYNNPVMRTDKTLINLMQNENRR